jgi:hypothetical protein
VFTARYSLSPYIKQIRFVFKGLMSTQYATRSGPGTLVNFLFETLSAFQDELYPLAYVLGLGTAVYKPTVPWGIPELSNEIWTVDLFICIFLMSCPRQNIGCSAWATARTTKEAFFDTSDVHEVFCFKPFRPDCEAHPATYKAAVTSSWPQPSA